MAEEKIISPDSQGDNNNFSSDQQQLLELLKTNLVNNKEILKSVKFLKNYFYWRTIFNTIKWVILILIVILGIISLKPVVSSLQGYVDNIKSYSEQLESASEQVNNLKGLININAR